MLGWRQGVLALAEAISVDKAENGWFVPNCDEMPALLNAANADMRRAVRVPMLEDLGVKVNVLQVINQTRWSYSCKIIDCSKLHVGSSRRSTTGSRLIPSTRPSTLSVFPTRFAAPPSPFRLIWGQIHSSRKSQERMERNPVSWAREYQAAWHGTQTKIRSFISAPVRRFPDDLGLASDEDLFGFSDAPAEEDIFAFGYLLEKNKTIKLK